MMKCTFVKPPYELDPASAKLIVPNIIFNQSKMTSPSKIGISVAYMLLYCIQPELSLQALSLNVCFCMRGKKSPFGNSISFISHPYSNLDTFIIIFFTGISKGDTTFNCFVLMDGKPSIRSSSLYLPCPCNNHIQLNHFSLICSVIPP